VTWEKEKILTMHILVLAGREKFTGSCVVNPSAIKNWKSRG
jgi:hypothetical protein